MKNTSPRRAAYKAHQREGRPVQVWRPGFGGRMIPIHVPRSG